MAKRFEPLLLGWIGRRIVGRRIEPIDRLFWRSRRGPQRVPEIDRHFGNPGFVQRRRGRRLRPALVAHHRIGHELAGLDVRPKYKPHRCAALPVPTVPNVVGSGRAFIRAISSANRFWRQRFLADAAMPRAKKSAADRARRRSPAGRWPATRHGSTTGRCRCCNHPQWHGRPGQWRSCRWRRLKFPPPDRAALASRSAMMRASASVGPPGEIRLSSSPGVTAKSRLRQARRRSATMACPRRADVRTMARVTVSEKVSSSVVVRASPRNRPDAATDAARPAQARLTQGVGGL